ncbi:hypothetical protein FERRO_15140 [Ferrovum sp. JA12]|uniref:hypothetical protein n=1 Tax=Ferrovum sp. JA12 TaxID=1356299 RepID=UPI0007036D8F|nr:hypothetical protein [Ferrovum sp. JA12]KRH78523.1 hypothetical protein FERRO_15140 [Ferrovum sp. JA12]
MPLDLLNRHILALSSFHELSVLPKAATGLKALVLTQLTSLGIQESLHHMPVALKLFSSIAYEVVVGMDKWLQ